jgi:hypothetical protein
MANNDVIDIFVILNKVKRLIATNEQIVDDLNGCCVVHFDCDLSLSRDLVIYSAPIVYITDTGLKTVDIQLPLQL